jgi:uncharacterized protein YkwD
MGATAARTGRRAAGAAIAVFLALSAVLAGQDVARAGNGYRSEMFQLTNDSRVSHDVRRLKLDLKLCKRARRHSAWMARNRRLEHSSSSDVSRYLRGRNWDRWGENIGYSRTDLEDLQDAFMDSPSHRHNILSRAFDRAGVGVVRRGGRLWATVILYG